VFPASSFVRSETVHDAFALFDLRVAKKVISSRKAMQYFDLQIVLRIIDADAITLAKRSSK